MLTIILPGYSPRNKEWAYQVKKHLITKGEVEVFEWEHWNTQKEMHIDQEVRKILSLIGEDKVNIIAKSIGTKVFMELLPQIKDQIERAILCGIPFDPKSYLSGIKLLNPQDLLIIQNAKDPFMPYLPISAFIKLINKKIKVIKKESDTHDYPYYKEFSDFLAD